MDFDEWIGEAIAEYAEDLGVAPQDLSERERLEALEDRIDRHARAAPAPRRREEREPAPEPRLRRESVRTAPEPEIPRRDREPRDSREEAYAAPKRAPGGDRLERMIQDIERRAERNEDRTAKALESLTDLVASRDVEGPRLESAVADIEMRAQRNEERTAAAIESLQHLVASRGGERERLVQAVAEVETRAQRNAERTAKALESISQLVVTRDEERERLEAAVERANQRNEESEARAARAFESLSAMVAKSTERRAPEPAERPRAPVAAPPRAPLASSPREPLGSSRDPVAERLSQLSRRAAPPVAEAPRADEDDEALRLVSERLARRRRLKGEAPARPAPPAPELADAFGDLRHDLRRLADKVDHLADGAVGTAAIDALRAQTREVERALVMAGEKVAGADRLHAQVGGLVQQVERLASAQPASSEMAHALKALADAHAKVDRDDPVKALKSVERQLDELGARVEAAARRPPQESRALEDLSRRVEAVRTAVERQPRPDTGEFVAALAALNHKLDAAAASGSQSAAQLSALAGMVARLEAEVRRPTSVSLDPQPLEDLGRRIESVRAAVERQPRPDTGEFAAALARLNDKLDAAAASGSQSATQVGALAAMVARLEEEVRRPTAISLDPQPLEDLGRRIEAVRTAVERQARPETGEFVAALAALNHKLDEAAASGSQSATQINALAAMVVRLEEEAQRPAPVALDPRPLEDLGRRIEGVHGRLTPKVDDLKTALDALTRKLDRPAAAPAESARFEAALADIRARLDRPTTSPAESARLEAALADIRARLDRPTTSAAEAARLEAALDDLRARLDRPTTSPAEAARLEASLDDIRARLDRLSAKPADAAKFEAALDDLRARLDRPATSPAEAARLEASLDDIRARLDRPTTSPAEAARLEASLADICGRLDRLSAKPADAAKFEAALDDLRARLDRPATSPAEAARLEAQLADIRARLDRPATSPAETARLDAALDDIRARLDRLSTSPAETARLEAQLADIRARLDRPTFAPQMEAVEAALRRMAAKVEETAARPVPPAFDSQPLEDLVRRIDGAHGRLGPKVDNIHAALGELSAKIERPARTTAEIARIEDALRRLGAQVETALARPGPFDPQAIEALAQRIDAVRGAAEANGALEAHALGPQVQRLEDGLAEIRARLDQPAYTPQIEAVDATLRRLAAKFEEAAARPTTVSLDSRPIEDLARRIESVRASLETSPSLAPQVERLETALGVVSDKLDRAAAPVDAQGINATLAQMNRRLEEAFRRPPEFEREQIDALSAQVEAVRETVERQTQHFDGAEAALREAVERIERPSPGTPELIVLVNAVKALATKIERVSGFDQARFEMLFAEWTERLARQTGAPPSVKPLIEAVATLGDRIDRMGPGDEPALHLSIAEVLSRIDEMSGRDSRIEGALREVGERLGSVEHRLGAPEPSGEGWAHIEFAVRDLTEKVVDLRAASDTRAVEQDVRALHEKIDDLAEISLDARAAPATAPVNHDFLLEPLFDIQERLDKLASIRSIPPALDHALADFADQMDALRAAREETARDAATVADLRADHVTFDRRMDARFSGVQDVLERLVDRIARLEREPSPNARPPSAPTSFTPTSFTPMSFPTRPAMPDIPDRETPARPPAPEAPILAPPPRLREEPGAAKAAVLNAHIAAARRKASAVAETEERAPTGGAAQAFAQRAHALLTVNSRPVLLGAAGALTLLTGFAAYELHGRAPVHKSEIEAPVAPSTSLGAASGFDDTPTGSIDASPKVIAAPLPAPSPSLSPEPAPSPQASLPPAKPASALVAALPAGLGSALSSAAARGDLGAEVEIAQRYLEGRTVPRDPKIAADWLQSAADAGSPFANYRLGALYEKGVGVARDLGRARALYTKAADAGNARAMHNLAVLYAQDGGQGKPDYPSALEWFRRAGAYGVRDSQFNLGVLYGRGLGGSQDLAQSWLWFSLGAKQGDTDAAHKRDEVSIRMDAKTMGAAKKLLDDFKIKTPDPAVNDPPPAPPAAADAAPAKKEIKAPV